MNKAERHILYMLMYRAEKKEEHWKKEGNRMLQRMASDRAQGIWSVLEAFKCVDDYCKWSDAKEREN